MDKVFSAMDKVQSTIIAQKDEDIVKISFNNGMKVGIQELKLNPKYNQGRNSSKGSYIMVNDDGKSDTQVDIHGNKFDHNILYKYVVSHLVSTKLAVVTLFGEKFVKKEITKLLVCDLYCSIISRKEKDFILLKILTTMCNSHYTCYLLYNTEKKIIELLKLRSSQVECDFGKVVPAETLATAKTEMVSFLTKEKLLYDIRIGINIANPKYAEVDAVVKASKHLQLAEFEQYVPENYIEAHEVAKTSLAENNDVANVEDGEEVVEDSRRKSSRAKPKPSATTDDIVPTSTTKKTGSNTKATSTTKKAGSNTKATSESSSKPSASKRKRLASNNNDDNDDGNDYPDLKFPRADDSGILLDNQKNLYEDLFLKNKELHKKQLEDLQKKIKELQEQQTKLQEQQKKEIQEQQTQLKEQQKLNADMNAELSKKLQEQQALNVELSKQLQEQKIINTELDKSLKEERLKQVEDRQLLIKEQTVAISKQDENNKYYFGQVVELASKVLESKTLLEDNIHLKAKVSKSDDDKEDAVKNNQDFTLSLINGLKRD